MKYRTLSGTGINVSVLGFGGSSLGSVFRPVEEADAIRTVHTALDHGINLIDTAPYYGATKAEEVLGRALRGIPRERYLLATKVARYGGEDFDFSAGRAVRSVEESLARLGVEYVDFIQVHDIEFGDLEQILHETLPALHRVRDAGKARFVGVSGLPLKVLRRAIEHGGIDQIQSYCHYCLHDTTLETLLPLVESHGLALFSSAPLAMRLLSDEGPPDWHPAPPTLRAACAEAARHCRERGTSLARLALQFAVANPRIPTTIVGTASPARILENIETAGTAPDAELLREVLAILEPVRNLTWPSGRPENN